MDGSFNIFQGIIQGILVVFNFIAQVLMYTISIPVGMVLVFGLVIKEACADMNLIIGDFIGLILAIIIIAIPIVLIILLLKKKISGKRKYIALAIILLVVLGIVLLIRHYTYQLLDDIFYDVNSIL